MPRARGACSRPFDDMQLLTQPAAADLRGEPGAGLRVAVVIIEHEEIADCDPSAAQTAEVADAVRLGCDGLRDPAA